jgi:cyanophycinase
VLGIGIDEDTAIVVRDSEFTVVGSGAVYVFDAEPATSSNIADARPDELLSIHGVRLDVLAAGERFDLEQRRPIGEDEPVSAGVKPLAARPDARHASPRG